MKYLDVSKCHEDSPDFRAGLDKMEVSGGWLRGNCIVTIGLVAYINLSLVSHVCGVDSVSFSPFMHVALTTLFLAPPQFILSF